MLAAGSSAYAWQDRTYVSRKVVLSPAAYDFDRKRLDSIELDRAKRIPLVKRQQNAMGKN